MTVMADKPPMEKKMSGETDSESIDARIAALGD